MASFSFQQRLRQTRKARGMTQEQLEAASGVSQSIISALEIGTRTPESLSSGLLFDLCKALQTNPIWLMTGHGPESHKSLEPQLVKLLEAASGIDAAGMEALIATAKAIKR